MQSIKRLEPGNETPIPPTSYYHLMLNVSNAPDVGYHLSRHPELIAKLWSLESSGNGIQAMKELNDLSAGLRFQGSQREGNTSPNGTTRASPRSSCADQARQQRWIREHAGSEQSELELSRLQKDHGCERTRTEMTMIVETFTARFTQALLRNSPTNRITC
jgi:hypothetical protein